MYNRDNTREKAKMVFETLADLVHYIGYAEPESINGFRVAGELYRELRDNAERARADWWPSCSAFGCMEEYDMGEGEYLEIDQNGTIINSSVYF